MHKILIALTATLTAAPISTIGATVLLTETQYPVLDLIDDDFLKNDIVNNSKFLGNEPYLEYNGKKFYSEDELNEYLLNFGYLKEESTISNPNKIITNYDSMALDQKKIYSTDLNGLQMVYRDAYGNVQTDKNQAFASYTNEGLVKEEYSYDHQNWYNTPETAKIALKDKMEIQKSLFYNINGQYYNAFSDQDINALINTFTDGYHLTIDKTFEGDLIPNDFKNKTLFGTKKEMYQDVKQALRPLFIEDKYGSTKGSSTKTSYLSKVINIEKDFILAIKPHSNFALRESYFNGNWIKDYDSDSTIYIKFSPNYYSNINSFFDLKDNFIIKKNFWANNWWQYREPYGLTYRYNWVKTFHNIAIDTDLERIKNTKIFGDRRIDLFKVDYGFIGDAPNIEHDFDYSDSTIGTVRLFQNKDKKSTQEINLKDAESIKREGLYNANSLTSEEINRLYDKWYDFYFTKVLDNFGIINGKKLNYERLKIGKDEDGNGYISSNNPNNLNSKDLIGEYLIDKIYNLNGESLSLIESYETWINVDKPSILSKEVSKDEEGKNLYEIKTGFLVNKEGVDKFFSLAGTTETIKMFYLGSDIYQKFYDTEIDLSRTEQEAKEKQAMRVSSTLITRYVAYDIYGKKEWSEENPQKAMDTLRNQTFLTAKWISKDEIKSWPVNHLQQWNDLISDGRYTVYSVENPLNKQRIYFPSREDALKFLKGAVSYNSAIKNQLDEIYFYKFIIDNEHTFEIIYYNKDYEYVLDQLKTYIATI